MIKTLDSEIDDVTEKVAKLKEARQISRRANKAKILEKKLTCCKTKEKYLVLAVTL